MVNLGDFNMDDGKLQLTAAALVVTFGLFWVIDALNQNTPNYQWINNKWLPRLFWTKRADQYAEAGYLKVWINTKGSPSDLID